MTTQSSQKKEGLVKVLDEAERKARNVQARAQKTVEDATATHELAGALRDLITRQPDDSTLNPEAWQHLTSSWQAHNDQASAVENAIAVVEQQLYSATTHSSVLSTTVSVLNSSGWFPTNRSPEACRVLRIVERPELFDEVKGALARFFLREVPEGTRSPVELINEAKIALYRPSSPTASPSAVLIPARESVNQSLALLLRHRATQEPTKNVKAKVVSIGCQLGLKGLPADHFGRLAEDLDMLMPKLSSAKQTDLSPQMVATLFREVLQFHKAFLESLDIAKLHY